MKGRKGQSQAAPMHPPDDVESPRDPGAAVEGDRDPEGDEDAGVLLNRWVKGWESNTKK